MKPTVFEFTSYDYKPSEKRAVFTYKSLFLDQEPLVWTETLHLPKTPQNEPPKRLLESLHIMLGISYWKFHCAPKISLPYQLTKDEASFWNTVYKKGLGEFFYRNNLDPKISPKFQETRNKKQTNSKFEIRNSSFPTRQSLVGVGGGKDSIVAVELLKQHGFDITGFNVESKQSALIEEVIKIAGIPDLKITRQLDEKVKLQHPYNGHIPISAVYAFLGIFACIAYGYKNFIVANEHSSNFGNIKYKGLEINHQWSKSLEFEKLFQNYIHQSISSDVVYFSLLRPFYEIRIVKLFAKYPQYFSHFSSCNVNFSTSEKGTTLRQAQGKWCGECAKCVFAFTLLSAFLSKKELVKMFGKNLYEQEALLPLFKDVLGFGTMKPFDCVGTFEEAQTALKMAEKKFANNFIMRQLSARAKLSPEVFQAAKENAIPEEFKFVPAQSVYILGYGKEGKITKQFLKKFYPKLKVGVGDSALNKNYLALQKNYDLAIKTPGINKNLVTIPHTTATNIFFSHVKGKNTIVGITGSKGKSTTSSLIYHILKTAKKDVELLGNIGKPMLEALLKPTPSGHIFVLELSSYQLDDIAFSPDIAVITSLFPEHMDFHGGLKNYYAAKMNIAKFQKTGEHFINQPKAKKHYETSLLGQHNQNNIQAAVEVAKILNIPQEIITKAIVNFQPLPHRLEYVGTFKEISFYNDANAATPEATIQAIKALKNIDTLFLGGQDRGYNFIQLEKIIRQYKIKNLVLFPDSGKKMLATLRRGSGQAKGFNILHTKSMQQAVKFAYQHTAKGKICLLSCASPSYSLWKNFEEKGTQFKHFVKKYS